MVVEELSELKMPTTDCDVLVVGMGMAGLIAANRAVELGVNVIIMDKLPSGWWIGGDVIISGQGIHIGYQSPLLPEEKLVEIIRERTGGRAIPELVNALVGNIHRGIKWLEENGVEFEESRQFGGVVLKPRKTVMGPWSLIKPGATHDSSKYGGKKAMEVLESLLKERGVRVLYETKAVKLLMDTKGDIVGIIAKNKDGLFKIKSKGTILCTGGFQRNKEMLMKYIGTHADEVPLVSGPGATGDGILMGLEVGATVRSMSYRGYTTWPEAASVNEDLRYLGVSRIGLEGIIVNKNGERFCDESLGSRMTGIIMTKLLDTVGLMVIDEELYKQRLKPVVDSVLQYEGTVYKADTIRELAEKAGVSPYLVTTVNEFNRAVEEGKTSQLRIPKTARVNKIATPPFYGVPFTLGVISTYGGLLVNEKGEVLDRDSEPIIGLYAAGAVMQGSLSGGVENRYAAYVGHLATCLVFGIISAENASEHAKASNNS